MQGKSLCLLSFLSIDHSAVFIAVLGPLFWQLRKHKCSPGKEEGTIMGLGTLFSVTEKLREVGIRQL